MLVPNINSSFGSGSIRIRSTPGIALVPALDVLVQARVGQQLEGLVADLRVAHVRDPPDAAAEDRRDPLLEVVDVGNQRVHDDDELRSALDGEVDVRRGADAAVDELASLDLDRPVDHREGSRCRDRLGDRHVVPAARAEHDPFAGVEVGRGQVELVLEQPEVVRPVGVLQDLPDVLLDAGARVHARGQRLGQPRDDVHHRHLAPARGDASAQGPPGAAETAIARVSEVRVVRLQKRARGSPHGMASGPGC